MADLRVEYRAGSGSHTKLLLGVSELENLRNDRYKIWRDGCFSRQYHPAL